MTSRQILLDWAQERAHHLCCAQELEEQLASARLSCTELTAELEQARQEGAEAASRSERAERQLLAAQEAVAGLKAAGQEPYPLHENGNGNANPIPNGTHDPFLKVQQPTGVLHRWLLDILSLSGATAAEHPCLELHALP